MPPQYKQGLTTEIIKEMKSTQNEANHVQHKEKNYQHINKVINNQNKSLQVAQTISATTITTAGI